MTTRLRKTEVPCKWCGYPIWLAPASREYLDKVRSKGTIVLLDPFEDAPGSGGLSAGPDGRIVIDDVGGTFSKHGCPTSVFSCKYCGEPVIRLLAPPGTPERMMILDAEPRGDGMVAIDQHGHGVRDPGCRMEGAHYYWHTMHKRTREAS